MTEPVLSIPCKGGFLAAELALPVGQCRGAVVLLHPSDDPSRSQFLFEHLARVLPTLGLAVLRYDRRGADGNGDIPYLQQVDDLSNGLRVLQDAVGDIPIGLWGFSQGAWVALLAAAAKPALAFLILVGCSTVSPARQMRFGTAEQLRRAGYGAEQSAELHRLRSAWEEYQRGHLSRAEAQAVVDELAGRPWFHLSWVPAALPAKPSWKDMDFDPVDAISQVHCPVLAFYGDDEWVPVEESIGIWRDSFRHPDQLTIRRIAGTDHHPTLGNGRTIASISPEYTATLTKWVTEVLHAAGQNRPGAESARPVAPPQTRRSMDQLGVGGLVDESGAPRVDRRKSTR